MINGDARSRLERQIPALANAVNQLELFATVEPHVLAPLPTTGLAHDHIRIGKTDMVLRVPRQSQLSLDASTNLRYQQTCFERMEPSKHTPRIYATIDPQPEIPMGALLVEFIQGYANQSSRTLTQRR